MTSVADRTLLKYFVSKSPTLAIRAPFVQEAAVNRSVLQSLRCAIAGAGSTRLRWRRDLLDRARDCGTPSQVQRLIASQIRRMGCARRCVAESRSRRDERIGIVDDRCRGAHHPGFHCCNNHPADSIERDFGIRLTVAREESEGSRFARCRTGRGERPGYRATPSRLTE